MYLSHGWGLYSRDPGDGSDRLRGTPASLFLPDEDADAFTGLPFYSGVPCKVEKIGARAPSVKKKKARKKTPQKKAAAKKAPARAVKKAVTKKKKSRAA